MNLQRDGRVRSINSEQRDDKEIEEEGKEKVREKSRVDAIEEVSVREGREKEKEVEVEEKPERVKVLLKGRLRP